VATERLHTIYFFWLLQVFVAGTPLEVKIVSGFPSWIEGWEITTLGMIWEMLNLHAGRDIGFPN
jgi:hypothetical protein